MELFRGCTDCESGRVVSNYVINSVLPRSYSTNNSMPDISSRKYRGKKCTERGCQSCSCGDISETFISTVTIWQTRSCHAVTMWLIMFYMFSNFSFIRDHYVHVVKVNVTQGVCNSYLNDWLSRTCCLVSTKYWLYMWDTNVIDIYQSKENIESPIVYVKAW